MILYSHQQEAVEAIENSFKSGYKKSLSVLATGSGKTIIFLYLVDKWVKAGARVLILAHRRELIHQPIDRAKEFFPDLYERMGIVMASEDETDAQVVVATVQTLNRNRLTKQEFDYVVLDECHHGTAKMYLNLFKRFKSAKWIGLTATPFRHDGDALAKVFDTVSYRFPITAAIDREVLVSFDAYGFSLPLTLDGVTETMDGWEEKALGTLLSAENALEIVYAKWLEYCHDRPTICFTSSVAQAYATAKYFSSKNVQAQAVDGSTPKKKRDGILKAFREGKIQVVCNCQVWTEGVDVPEASAALMVCPTKSDLAYVQKLGRVLRTCEGKKNAVVLDFAPLEDRNIVMAGDILGVPRIEKKAKEKAEKAGVMVRATRVDDRGLAVSVDPTVLIVEALQYLRKGFLAWALKDYVSVAALSDTVLMAIELPDVPRVAKAEELRSNGDWNENKERLYDYLRQFHLWKCYKKDNRWYCTLVGIHETMKESLAQGEKLVNDGYLPHLARKRKAWRKRPVSVKQLMYMKSLGVNPPDGCNQGQAAQLISHELASDAINKYKRPVESKIYKGKTSAEVLGE